MSADGQTITGQFLIDVHAVPFTLKRNGEARIAPPPKSAAIDAKLAGSWSGALVVGSQSLPLAADAGESRRSNGDGLVVDRRRSGNSRRDR